MIKALLDAGADPNAAGPDGQTPLMMVARTANVAAAKLLLDKGANPNVKEAQRGQTALMWAAASQPGPHDARTAGARRGGGREVRHRSDDAAGQLRSRVRSLVRRAG